MHENRPETGKNGKAEDNVIRQLNRADFSRAAFKSRAQLRQSLVDKAARREARPGRRLVVAFEFVGFAALALVFLFAVSRLVENRSATPAALQASLTPSATLPAPTGTLPAPGETPAPDRPTPTAVPRIDMSSSPDAVRIAISQPSWKTLWGELEIAYYANGNTEAPESRVYAQAWLENGGRGLVLSSDPVPGQISFNYDISANWVDIYKDGKVTRLDKKTGEQTETDASGVLYPLAGSSPAMQLVYPDFLMILSSEPSLVKMDSINGRYEVVADWGNSRLWVDCQTGLLLRVERYDGKPGESSLQAVLSFHQVLVDTPIQETVFSPQYPNELAFQRPPSTEALRPTPTPWANASKQGWIYLQAAAGAPFEWKVYSLPAACLFQEQPCGDPWLLPGNPNYQISGLSWSPDHNIGLYSDTNNNQLVALDVKTRQWQRAVEGFYQLQLTWSPDGSRIAALTEGDGAYDMKLVTIQRSDWQVNAVPTNLKGEKQVLGWLDGQSLAVIIPDITNFKGGTPDWAATDFHPGIYRINVDTGQADPLPIAADLSKRFGLQLSPDGSQFAYWQWNDGLAEIYLAAPDGTWTRNTKLQGTSPTFSADGQWILFRQEQTAGQNQLAAVTLFIAHPDGSGLKRLLETNGTLETAWSPDGKYLFVSEVNVDEKGTKNLYLYSLEDGTLKKIDLPSMTGSQVLNLLGWEP